MKQENQNEYFNTVLQCDFCNQGYLDIENQSQIAEQNTEVETLYCTETDWLL